MSVKQDRSYARTAQDIERKYSFGKTFADMLGLINENRDKVDSVESSLTDKITQTETSLKRNTEEVVIEAKRELYGSIDNIGDSVDELSSKVEMKLNADELSIEVEKVMSSGVVDEVITKTGYSFGSDGLKISKSGDEMENLLDNTGMYVKKSGTDVLVANNLGVQATDLHAKTYLKIGAGVGRSRFEDYLTNRTACFWIGG